MMRNREGSTTGRSYVKPQMVTCEIERGADADVSAETKRLDWERQTRLLLNDSLALGNIV